MRCADRGPTPGRILSASINRSRPPAVGTRSLGTTLKRQLEPGRQPEPRGEAAHLLGDRLLDATHRVVECGGDQVLEHLAIVADKRRINRDSLDLMLAGHYHLDHARARLALDLHRRELLLHAAHVLLHHLRLLHQLTYVSTHRRPPLLFALARRLNALLDHASIEQSHQVVDEAIPLYRAHRLRSLDVPLVGFER